VTDTAVEADAEAEPLGRRERKKLETRRALAGAAVRLAAERGPDQVTIEEIADAVDVSVRTFFNYFSSKEEAIIGWDPEGLQAIVDRLVGRPADEAPFIAIRAVLSGLFEGVEEWADERALRHRLVREHPSLLPRFLAAHHDLERSLLRGMAARLGVEPDGSLYAAVVVTTSVNAMRLALTWWEAKDRAVSITDLLNEAFDALERGLVPPTRKAT
jgi:AcrR family transcriptional regulator